MQPNADFSLQPYFKAVVAEFHALGLEVDTLPPLGFATEEKLLFQPFSFYVKCFSLSDLFAGKLHALLFRQWKNRVKGRDWFDFEWYVRHNVTPNLEHFAKRAYESGAIRQDAVSKAELQKLLEQRIKTVDFENAKQDVVKFIPDTKVLNIWSTDYFLQLTHRLIGSF